MTAQVNREQAIFIAPLIRGGFGGIFGPTHRAVRRSILMCLTGDFPPLAKSGYHVTRQAILDAMPVGLDRCAAVRERLTIEAIEALAAEGGAS